MLRYAAEAQKTSALVATCGPEAHELVSTWHAGSVTCIAGDSPAPRTSAVTVLQKLPRAGEHFDLLLVPSDYFHAQLQPAMALRQLRMRLTKDAVAIIECDSATANIGLSSVQEMVRLVLDEKDDNRTRLQLAFSLLQSLPPSNWMIRNEMLRQGVDWTEIGSLSARLTNAHALRPTPELLVHEFVREICRSNMFQVIRVGGLVGYERNASAHGGTSVTLGHHLRPRLRAMPWLWRAQFKELVGGSRLKHIAVLRAAQRPGMLHQRPRSCHARTLKQLDGLERVLGVVGGARSLRAASGYSANGSPTAALRAAAAVHLSTVAAAAAAEVAVSRQYELLPFPPRRAQDEYGRKPLHSSLASLVEITHFLFGGRFRRRFCASAQPFRALVAGGGSGDATVQLAAELHALHVEEPQCGYDRSEIVHLDLSRAACTITVKRLQARGLAVRGPHRRLPPHDQRDTWDHAHQLVHVIHGSLLSLQALALGRFDFVNLV